jgi:hypothetical protein
LEPDFDACLHIFNLRKSECVFLCKFSRLINMCIAIDCFELSHRDVPLGGQIISIFALEIDTLISALPMGRSCLWIFSQVPSRYEHVWMLKVLKLS